IWCVPGSSLRSSRNSCGEYSLPSIEITAWGSMGMSKSKRTLPVDSAVGMGFVESTDDGAGVKVSSTAAGAGVSPLPHPMKPVARQIVGTRRIREYDFIDNLAE